MMSKSQQMEELVKLAEKNANEETLIEDNRTLEEVIREVAEGEGMTYEETLKLFKKGMKEANNYSTKPMISAQQKAKNKKKKKMAKASKKRNR